mmetsp:Transcript_3554/g.12945  ORF Transcript_3554/g.12945 Transcript_3554/m.12945 type:complete len:227 (-) Transcript_3554:270-950(-)
MRSSSSTHALPLARTPGFSPSTFTCVHVSVSRSSTATSLRHDSPSYPPNTYSRLLPTRTALWKCRGAGGEPVVSTFVQKFVVVSKQCRSPSSSCPSQPPNTYMRVPSTMQHECAERGIGVAPVAAHRLHRMARVSRMWISFMRTDWSLPPNRYSFSPHAHSEWHSRHPGASGSDAGHVNWNHAMAGRRRRRVRARRRRADPQSHCASGARGHPGTPLRGSRRGNPR